MSDELGVSDHEAFRALVESEAWLALSAVMADTFDRSGRRRLFEPHVLMLFFYGATVVWKSARKTAAHFADADHWAFLQRIVREHYPDDQSVWLPAVAPRRHHYLYFRRHHLDPKVNELKEVFEDVASRQAVAVGLCDPDGGGSWTHPAKTRTLTADGKVKTPIYKSKKPTKVDRTTGEIRQIRCDPDARVHKSGDNRWLWGNKFEILHVRGPEPHARIVLSVDAVDKAEGDTLLAMLDRVTPRLPGIQAIAYDGGIHGVHTNQILIRNGIVPIVPAPGSLADTPPMPRLLQAAGGYQIFTQLGAPGIGHLTEDGDIAFERLNRRNTGRRRNADGTFRWYGEYDGPNTPRIRLRLDQTADDKARGFNRAEHLRPIAKGDSGFDSYMGLRSDSESLNRYLEDSLFNGRAHSVGRLRQLVDLIGFASGVNAVAVRRHRRTKAPPGALAA